MAEPGTSNFLFGFGCDASCYLKCPFSAFSFRRNLFIFHNSAGHHPFGTLYSTGPPQFISPSLFPLYTQSMFHLLHLACCFRIFWFTSLSVLIDNKFLEGKDWGNSTRVEFGRPIMTICEIHKCYGPEPGFASNPVSLPKEKRGCLIYLLFNFSTWGYNARQRISAQ